MRNLFLLMGAMLCLTFYSCKDDPTCFDGEINGDETGIDCGGADCQPCAFTSCTDGVQNGDETGVDCGGADCSPCGVTPTCTDGIQNGDETGVDCGGSCEACTDCPGTLANTFSYQVDGTNAAFLFALANISSGNLVIQVSNSSPSTLLSITVDDSLFSPGTYNIGNSLIVYYSIGNDEFQSVAAGSTGSITFTEFSTETDCEYVSGSLDVTLSSASGSTAAITATFSQLAY